MASDRNSEMSQLKRKKETRSDMNNSATPSPATPPCSVELTKATDIQQPIQKKKPLIFCRVMVQRPKLIFGVLLLFHILLLIGTGLMLLAGYDILPIDFSGVPLNLETDDTFLRSLAWRNRNTDKIIPKSNAEKQSLRSETVELYFEGENVFTKRNLKAMASLENDLVSIPEYQTVCLKNSRKVCTKPYSVIRLFDGTFGPSFNDSTFSSIPSVMQRAIDDPIIKEKIDFFFGKDCIVEAAHGLAECPITRSLLYFGYPLTDSKDVTEEKKLLENFLRNHLRDRLNKLHEKGYNQMSVLFSSSTLFRLDLENQVIFDLLLACGSMTFIFLFMVFQTHSLFITSLSLLGILTSFLFSNMIYRIVFDYRYFGIFHVLSIFIILAIGADDVFIFYDNWRATAHDNISSLEDRLSECYRRVSLSMLITSLTTVVAFISNAFSPLLAVSSFGIFSATLVFINYLTAITFFPSVVVIYHLYFENWTWPCCRLFAEPCVTKRSISPLNGDTSNPDVPRTARKNFAVRFFFNYYFKFITHVYVRWILVLLLLALITVFVFFAKDLQPAEESTKVFKDNHNYQMANERRLNAFKPSNEDRIIKIYMVWGLKNQDRSKCHKTDQDKCIGDTVWDEAFDLNPKPAQMELQKLCSLLQSLSDDDNKHLHIRKNSVTRKMEVQCFLDCFEHYLLNEGNKTTYNDTARFHLPSTETTVMQMMKAHPELYSIDDSLTHFYRFFETALSFWLQDGYSSESHSYDSRRFSEVLGMSRDLYDTKPILNNAGYMYGTRLRYAAITVNTSISVGNLGYESGMPIYEAWENFFNEKVKKLPPSLSGGFQCTPEGNNEWHWFKVGKVLADSATQGIVVGVSLAFIVLTLATHNFIIGFLATSTISLVTVTIIGVIPMVGWKLGVLESLNLSLVVGLSVDYVVHLAEGYHLSKHQDRKSRVRDMLECVAVSIVSGAISTLGASLFMLFAQILFFVQFGIFMFCTTAFSLLYALVLFSTLLGIIGPENDVGSIKPIYRLLQNIITGRKRKDRTCKNCKGKGYIKEQDQRANSRELEGES